MIFTHNKMRLLRHFLKDPVLFAYHIGDLDDFFFPDCLWPALFGKVQGIDETLLTYTGGDAPTLLAFGLTDRFESLLRDYLPVAPARFYCHFQQQYRHIFDEYATGQTLGTYLKMKLDSDRLRDYSPAKVTEPTLQLDESHLPLLRDLYASAHPDNYFVPRMLQTGHYLGIMRDDRMVATAGVHVASDEHRIAVLGNITTHPDYRGLGMATRLTHELSARLSEQGKMVCLNVKDDNLPALACYEKIGFMKVHEYEEALFTLN
jgi:ribosomal protein S18 acetylase RimI-like enzyme